RPGSRAGRDREADGQPAPGTGELAELVQQRLENGPIQINRDALTEEQRGHVWVVPGRDHRRGDPVYREVGRHEGDVAGLDAESPYGAGARSKVSRWAATRFAVTDASPALIGTEGVETDSWPESRSSPKPAST